MDNATLVNIQVLSIVLYYTLFEIYFKNSALAFKVSLYILLGFLSNI